jgi:hypothetical protein
MTARPRDRGTVRHSIFRQVLPMFRFHRVSKLGKN